MYYYYIYHSRKYKCKCIQMPHWSHSQDTQWSNQSQNRHFHDHRRQAAQLAHAMTSGAWDEVDAEQTRRPGTAAPLGPPGGGVSQGAEVRRPSTTGGEGLGKRGLGLVEFFRMNCHESWWCSPQKWEMWIMWVMIMIGNFDNCDCFVSPNLPRCMRIPQPSSHGVGYVIFGIHMERHETQTLFHGQYKWLFKSPHYI